MILSGSAIKRPALANPEQADKKVVDRLGEVAERRGIPRATLALAWVDVVKAGKVRYIGASSMYAWQFAKALYTADLHGWTRFVSMQNHYNLIYREEERETMKLCAAEGIGVIPWSPLARGKLTPPWAGEATKRSETDPVQQGNLLSKPAITSPIVGATKPNHLTDAVAALQVKLAAEEIASLEEPYVAHPVVGFS